MARVVLADAVRELLSNFGPDDQRSVSRAIAILESDRDREENKVDLSLVEQGRKIWALWVGSVFLAFAEDPGDDITVVHIAMLSQFRYPKADE